MTEEEIKKFRKDRYEALVSLDIAKIRNFAEKYGEKLPILDEPFWRGVHKARVHMTDLSDEARCYSLGWLDARGSESLDDGRLSAIVRGKNGE